MKKNAKKDLIYNVWIEDINSKKIEIYNVFRNSRFYNGLITAKKHFKKTNDIETFKESIKKELMYAYWSKSEYEIILTSWPPYITTDEFEKLQTEVGKYVLAEGRKPYSLNTELTVSRKVDIYEQVMLNFDIFFNYILENIDSIPNKKEI